MSHRSFQRLRIPALILAAAGAATGCSNDVIDEAEFRLIESLANADPDLADATDLVRVEGFDLEILDPSDATPCSGEEGCASLDDLADLQDLEDGTDSISFASGMNVDQAVWSACSTSVLRALTDQLVSEIECMRPDTMGNLEGLSGVQLGSAALPYLQSRAVEKLIDVRDRSGSVALNSTLRSLAQQFLLYQWSQVGRCGIGLAARPGRSNHESGLAVDVSNWSARRSAFQAEGWRWLGSRDRVHFDYLGSGTVSLSGLSVLAFQRLWNRNNPNDQISEDGSYGPQTASRLSSAPTAGFDSGATCDAFGTDPEFAALEVYWSRQADGSYDTRALAPSDVTRVETFVDGFRIAVATTEDGANFPDNYTFESETDERRMDVVGLDANGDVVAAGVGFLDVGPGPSFSLKQMGEHLYEVFLERAPAGAASIAVSVDNNALVDVISGRSPSPRLAVRSQLNTLGVRTFTMTVHNDAGVVIDTLSRSFDLDVRIPDGAGTEEPGPEPTPESEPEPTGDMCDGIGSVGGVISEEAGCVELGGPTQYLRSVSGDGHESGYVWTGATSATTGTNFAKYPLNFATGGEFLVEVSIAPTASRTRSAEYFVRNQGSTKGIVVDQDAVSGFVGVGIFSFTAGTGQHIQLFDNTGETSSQNRRVVFDAVRLTPASALSCTSARVATSGNALNVRRKANTSESAVEQLDNNALVQGLGIVEGQNVGGETRWMRIRKGALTGYVSMSFLTCQN